MRALDIRIKTKAEVKEEVAEEVDKQTGKGGKVGEQDKEDRLWERLGPPQLTVDRYRSLKFCE